VGDLLKTQACRVRRLPPLMGRAGVGRIKSIAYTYSSEIVSRLFFNLFNEKSLIWILPTPPSPSGEGDGFSLQLVVLIKYNNLFVTRDLNHLF
jgi:hypothetical protein